MEGVLCPISSLFVTTQAGLMLLYCPASVCVDREDLPREGRDLRCVTSPLRDVTG